MIKQNNNLVNIKLTEKLNYINTFYLIIRSIIRSLFLKTRKIVQN